MGKGARAMGGWGLSGGVLKRRRALSLSFFSSLWSLQRKISTHPPTNVTGSDGSSVQPRSRHFTKCLFSCLTDRACYCLMGIFVGVYNSLSVKYVRRLLTSNYATKIILFCDKSYTILPPYMRQKLYFF